MAGVLWNVQLNVVWSMECRVGKEVGPYTLESFVRQQLQVCLESLYQGPQACILGCFFLLILSRGATRPPDPNHTTATHSPCPQEVGAAVVCCGADGSGESCCKTLTPFITLPPPALTRRKSGPLWFVAALMAGGIVLFCGTIWMHQFGWGNEKVGPATSYLPPNEVSPSEGLLTCDASSAGTAVPADAKWGRGGQSVGVRRTAPRAYSAHRSGWDGLMIHWVPAALPPRPHHHAVGPAHRACRSWGTAAPRGGRNCWRWWPSSGGRWRCGGNRRGRRSSRGTQVSSRHSSGASRPPKWLRRRGRAARCG